MPYLKCLTGNQKIGYLEETLSETESALVDAHLRVCEFCRMGIEAGKEALAKFDSGEQREEPIPREWIEKAVTIAEREWAKCG